MSGKAEESSRRPPAPAESSVHPTSPCPARSRRTSSSNHSTSSSDDSFLDDDATEEQIEAELVALLFRGAAPEAYAQAVAQQRALRAQREALRREVAESRAQVRRLREYTDLLLYADVSGYTEQQAEDYRRELQRRSKEFFGK